MRPKELRITHKFKKLLSEESVLPHFQPLTLRNTIGFSESVQLIQSMSKETKPLSHPSEQLITELLSMLAHELKAQPNPSESDKKKSDNPALTPTLIALGCAGVLNNALGGFNGIFSIMQLFTNNPWLLYIPGIVFAALSAIIFIGFDFSQGSLTLGVDFFNAPSSLDAWIEQQNNLLALRHLYDELILSANSIKDLTLISNLANSLDLYSKRLSKLKKGLANQDVPLFIWIMKKIFGALCGLMFLFTGYFTGQSGALFILGASSIAAGLSTPLGTLLIIGMGSISALGAVAFYYLLQRRAVENLVTRLMGYNENKIQQFTENDDSTALDNTFNNKKTITQQRLQFFKPTAMNQTDYDEDCELHPIRGLEPIRKIAGSSH